MKISKTLLAGIITACLIILFLLFNYKTRNSKSSFLKNGGFDRTRLSYNLSLEREFDLPTSSYGIIDIKQDTILIREFNKNSIIIFNPDHTKSTIQLPIQSDPRNIFSVSPNIFTESAIDVQVNNEGQIISFDYANQKVISRLFFPVYYDKAVRLSNNIFCCLLASDTANRMKFALVTEHSDSAKIILQSNFSIKSMSEDGMLRKWKDGFIYVNFYNNNFYFIDSNLSRGFNAKTIDTITVLPKTKSLKDNTIIKFEQQPRIVNQFSIVRSDSLFINSFISANNEDVDVLKKMNIIDIYDLKKNGKYVGSIFIDKYKGQPLHDFLIKENKILFVYSNKLLVYDISL